MWSGAYTAMSRSSLDVVCDAGPLIHLHELDCLKLLADFQTVLVPEQVWHEVEYHRPEVEGRAEDGATIVGVKSSGKSSGRCSRPVCATQIGQGPDRGSIAVSDHFLQALIGFCHSDVPDLYQQGKHPKGAGDTKSVTASVASGVEVVREQTTFPFKSNGDARGFAIIKNQTHVGQTCLLRRSELNHLKPAAVAGRQISRGHSYFQFRNYLRGRRRVRQRPAQQVQPLDVSKVAEHSRI
jgi:hypothetical protein